MTIVLVSAVRLYILHTELTECALSLVKNQERISVCRRENFFGITENRYVTDGELDDETGAVLSPGLWFCSHTLFTY
jgi:hypothetical protein